ncbi:hypothetical protein SAMN05518849_11992 [Sphingobium sp. AP50]|uniref:DUF4304 domain-containing protein n=1 Tax=Sphingobium sp. AP50 TaxID=1884369 RepID=UPI0008BD7889|nr:DUF4304 domain-containing protein [Sphingobium sp. AP50]SEJ93914.1 hypothetical protein SAMN05518849_11992 [Sphingobium sp. AP50]
MPGPHEKLIANAAKAILRPLGFQRKGQSRLWFFDHSWWLAVVEFQPSSWSKGSYLNVAAHWLWMDIGTISFDFGGRLEGFAEYASDEQFAVVAAGLANSAAEEAQRLATMFSSIADTTEVLLEQARTEARQAQAHPGWMAYNAGVTAGLAGRTDDAAEMFRSVLHSPVDQTSVLHLKTKRMSSLLPDATRLRQDVAMTIALQRETLRLPPWNASRF